MPHLDEAAVRDVLKNILEPELLKDLETLKMVKEVAIAGDVVTVHVELYTPAYLHRETLAAAVREAVGKLAGVTRVEVEYSAKVERRSSRPSEGGRLAGVKHVIAVAAGKGGVGKSTVASNLALALQRWGAKVGLLDADVYGPSMPTMLGAPERPSGQHEGRISPAIHYGMPVMSIGFFVERDGAVVWRGPMVHKLLQQFLDDVDWGELDYLVMDLPPGTGDAQLSLSQLVPITGAVMVTTPQEVALADVVKAVSMFHKVQVPILGVVENMSDYVCPACGHHDEIFSRGGGRKLAEALGATFLGELPIDAKVRFGGDSGRPVVVGAPESEHAQRFMDIAAKVATRIAVLTQSAPKRPAGLVIR